MIVNKIQPEQDQVAALMAWPKGQPLVMVNILKFKALTDAGDETGQEAYTRYMKNALPLIQQAGARVIWRGSVGLTVIGEAEGQPDVILLVEYPGVENFLAMASSDAYKAIAHDRNIALEFGGLLACNTLS